MCTSTSPALQLFNSLYTESGINQGKLEIRNITAIGKSKATFFSFNELAFAEKYISQSNGRENCYYGVAVRKDGSSGKKENCSLLTALYADLDYSVTGHKKPSYLLNKQDAMKLVDRIGLAPSIIVDSGHGLHLYWLLDKPIELNKDNVDLCEALMKKISVTLGGDNTQNVDRILRIPGTLNIKTEDKALCTILKNDKDLRYNLNDIRKKIEEESIFNLRWSLLTKDSSTVNIDGVAVKNPEAYKRAIFGSYNFGITDRSALDQKVITYLISLGFTDDEVRLVFRTYKTSGKYFERFEKDPSGANSYLNHSIKNASKYITENSTTMKQQQAEVLSLTPTSESSQDIEIFEDYKLIKSGEELGYYKRSFNKEKETEIKLSNFYIELDQQVRVTKDGETVSYFIGRIHLPDGIVDKITDKLFASFLGNARDFKNFLHNLYGTKVHFKGAGCDLLEAVKIFNKNISISDAVEYGYNAQLDCYYSSNCIVTKNGIEESNHSLRFDDIWGEKNKLTFIPIDKLECASLIMKTIKNLFILFEPKLILPVLAFIFLPIIYPFARTHITSKPYMLLRGSSGSGKSMLTLLMQRFYGNFEGLTGWTSTETSLVNFGNTFRDSLLCVDDLKLGNFAHHGDIAKAMRTIQNSSDGYSRNRSNTSLKQRDERYIKGILLLNGEDIVFTEGSTIARGIILGAKTLTVDHAVAGELQQLSRSFSGITAHFIQYLMQNDLKEEIDRLMLENKSAFNSLIVSMMSEMPMENVGRIVNNFSALSLSFQLFIKFLDEYFDKAFLQEYLQKLSDQFRLAVPEILMENIQRVNKLKPEIKFAETMWDLISTGHLTLENISSYDDTPKRKIGVYYKDGDNVKIGINMNTAFKEVNAYLYGEGGLGVTKDALITRLLAENMIKMGGTNRITLNGKLFRGVEWIGDFPRHLFINEKSTGYADSAIKADTTDRNDTFMNL